MDITDLLNPASISQNPTSAGIFCCVYRGQLYDGTAVAIKLRNPDDIWEMGRKSMPNLLAIWTRYNHPNIVRLIGKTTYQGRLAAVYEWHEYGGIKQYLESRPAVDRCQLGVQICDAVTYLHANGIIHGDLEGDQILISNDGVLRIPLSSEFASSWPFTHAAGGTFWLRWPAPEVRKGYRRTSASDVYALGMVSDRPDASRVPAVMRIVCQTPDHMVSHASKLVVKADTPVEDLVSHFEQHGLTNYTERLHPNNTVGSGEEGHRRVVGHFVIINAT
ncbi:unnamed protein product [Rhizoctonia solani]|uniref:Protein kinase domain-containing protein n=1 Tax=Rhizoctonia solani TaxID=456999 RepID=A0A8H2WX28_9AGAM|nr:unnamed protein product [Rhizoctonia solani]